MRVERRTARRALTLALLAFGAAAAVPTGAVLGDWVVFGAVDPASALARRWPAVVGLLLVSSAAAVLAQSSRPALRILLPALLLALGGWGAWQGVATHIDAWREGPLNAAL